MSELHIVCKSGNADDLRNLCEKYRLKQWHLGERFPDGLTQRDVFLGQPREKTADDLTPLHLACIYKNLEVVTDLVERGVDVTVIDSLGRTPFKCAIEIGAGSICHELHEQGSSMQVFRPDFLGQTPFHAAVEIGKPGHVEALRNWGSDINAAATIQVVHMKDGAATTHKICATPLHTEPLLNPAPAA